MKRNIVITGCNRGIGLELARLYAEAGDHIYALVRESSPEIEAIAKQVVTKIDVSASISELKSSLKDLPEIDVLINNAGLFKNEKWPLDDQQLAIIQSQFEVNTLGPLKITSALNDKFKNGALAAYMSSRMGSIVDNTSGAYYGYRMSKAALNMAVKSLSMDLMHQNVKTLALHPGYVKTRMTDFHGEITPQEAASGLYKILETASERESGSFWHSNGQELGW